MKIGVLQFFGWRDRSIPLEDVYARALARIEVMDRTGYDAVWLAEHHFTGYSVCPSVHMMATHIAARTQHLRIGTAVTLAAFYHPLRIAEEIALLDVLTGGRVNWGAGRGFDPSEFAVFGVPVEESTERFREAVEIVLAAWTNERLTFDGRFHRYEDVEVLPKPRQQPHPPTWMAASSPGAVEWDLNDVVIHGSPERVVDTLRRLEAEMPLDYLLLSPLSEKTFGLFTDRVLPHVSD
jgi:alkanesulfonate monooxygenase SsuD/methylene tetrahydromethanopterin reductase-like flavin-dependent oxidoreductase (luciferase family)